jgi:hypothetical protein
MNISSLDTSKVVKYAIGVLPNQENVVLRKLIFKIIFKMKYFLPTFRGTVLEFNKIYLN